ncbi:hypothetical protein MKX03_021102 [Papaver bracteatum]|nr:hypothetical protein MKX03_021102 [Papaver bracteatum]
MEHLFEYHPCAHVAVSCSCHVECTELENNPPLPELKIVLQCSRYKTVGDTSGTVFSRSDTCTHVIENFKSYDLVKHAIAGMLSYLNGLDPRCVDFVTDCVLNRAYKVSEKLGDSFRLTAHVVIKMDEKEPDLIHAVVTESMEEDSVRRIRASKSFIDGLKKQEFRHNNGDGKDSSSCAVCLEGIIDGSKIINMPCLHMFHSACLVTWLHESNSCPICRRQVDPAG